MLPTRNSEEPLYFIQPFVQSTEVAFAASLLAGAGIAWGGGMWIMFFVRLEPGEALIYTFASLGVSSLLGFFMGLMPPALAYASCIVLPAAALAMFRQAQSTLDERRQTVPEPTTDDVYDGESPARMAWLLVGLGIFECALGVARGFPSGEAIALPVEFQLLHQTGVLVLSLGIIWWVLVKGRRLRFTGLCWIILALLVGGVACITTLDGSGSAVGALLITVATRSCWVRCGIARTTSPATPRLRPMSCWG